MTKRFVHLIILLTLAGAFLPARAYPALAQTPQPLLQRGMLFVPGELIVSLAGAPSTPAAGQALQAAAGQVGAQVVKTAGSLALLQFDSSADVAAQAARVSTLPGVLYAEPNYVRSIPETTPLGKMVASTQVPVMVTENKDTPPHTEAMDITALQAMRSVVVRGGRALSVPTYPSDDWSFIWAPWQANAEIIWNEPAPSPTVCVVDTGVDGLNPDLRGKVINGPDFVNSDSLSADDNGHGTHIAGIIAAKANNGVGMWGISNGKVLAVKVLDAFGLGNDFDIFQGIMYCANNPSVRVINLSLGGPAPGATLYNALDTAILGKNKVVVAAAGDDSLSESPTAPGTPPYYPAGWAIATVLPPPGAITTDNKIANGLLSVGAARQWADPVWVDINGDGAEQANEVFYNCATSDSNYGSWVELAAPGADVYSTTPVSYPFTLNRLDGVPSGYASLSGTSQAAAHVAASAARVWSLSLNRSLPNSDITQKLLKVMEPCNVNGVETTCDFSTKLQRQVDPNVSSSPSSNLTKGYHAAGFKGEAPYCWPTDENIAPLTNPFTAKESMFNSRYINVAASMERGAIRSALFDAGTGLPLQGAKQRAIDYYHGNVYSIAQMVRPDSQFIDQINLPINRVVLLQVNKPGYTAGYQSYIGAGAIAGVFATSGYYRVSIPKNTMISVVANWSNLSATNLPDLALYVWTPDSPGIRRIVGQDPDILYPHLPDPADPGTLNGPPYARWQYSGGVPISPVTPIQISFPMESIDIRLRSGKAYYPGDYWVFVTDKKFNGLYLNNSFLDLSIRIWYRGRMISAAYKTYTQTIKDENKQDIPNPDYCNVTNGDYSWWLAGKINGSKFNSTAHQCGAGTKIFNPYGLWPYEPGTP